MKLPLDVARDFCYNERRGWQALYREATPGARSAMGTSLNCIVEEGILIEDRPGPVLKAFQGVMV